MQKQIKNSLEYAAAQHNRRFRLQQRLMRSRRTLCRIAFALCSVVMRHMGYQTSGCLLLHFLNQCLTLVLLSWLYTLIVWQPAWWLISLASFALHWKYPWSPAASGYQSKLTSEQCPQDAGQTHRPYRLTQPFQASRLHPNTVQATNPKAEYHAGCKVMSQLQWHPCDWPTRIEKHVVLGRFFALACASNKHMQRAWQSWT